MTKRTAARTQLDPAWQPSPEDRVAICKALLAARLTIDGEFEKFRDYHLAHGSLMASWSRAFRYWCRRAIELAPQKAPSAPQGAQELSPEAKAKARAWYLAHGMHVPMKLRD